MKAVATVTSKGQLTIPKAVRAALGVKAGDKLEFAIHPGRIELRPAKPRGSSAGILKKYLPKGWKPPTVEEIDAGIARYMARKFRRSS